MKKTVTAIISILTAAVMLLSLVSCASIRRYDRPETIQTDSLEPDPDTNDYYDTDHCTSDDIFNTEKPVPPDTGNCIPDPETFTPDTQTSPDTQVPPDTETPPEPALEPDVVCALEYSKAVIATPLSQEIGWSAVDYTHTIRIPAINIGSANASYFNAKLYNEFSDYLEILKNNQEDDLIIGRNYVYKIFAGYIAIIGIFTEAVQCGGVGISYVGYYYDATEDREITFDEYLDKVGVSRYDVMNGVAPNAAFADYCSAFAEFSDGLAPTVGNISCAALGTDGSIVCFRDDYTYMGSCMIECDSIIN